jgi:hypothetical protein
MPPRVGWKCGKITNKKSKSTNPLRRWQRSCPDLHRQQLRRGDPRRSAWSPAPPASPLQAPRSGSLIHARSGCLVGDEAWATASSPNAPSSDTRNEERPGGSAEEEKKKERKNRLRKPGHLNHRTKNRPETSPQAATPALRFGKRWEWTDEDVTYGELSFQLAEK